MSAYAIIVTAGFVSVASFVFSHTDWGGPTLYIILFCVIGFLLDVLVRVQKDRADDASKMDLLEDRNALLKMKIAELERDLRKARCNPR